MRLLVSDFIKNNKSPEYFKAFQDDINGWQFTLAQFMSELKHNKTLYIPYMKDGKKEKAFVYNYLNQSRIDIVIEETISNVHLMAYRYGVLNKSDNYKNIHGCKFIGGFVYYFMQHLPVDIDSDIETTLNNRRVNAIIAYHCMIQLMSQPNMKEIDKAKIQKITSDNYNRIYKAIGNDIRKEIIHRLVKRPLLEEWTYVYCRTLKQMINTN